MSSPVLDETLADPSLSRPPSDSQEAVRLSPRPGDTFPQHVSRGAAGWGQMLLSFLLLAQVSVPTLELLF